MEARIGTPLWSQLDTVRFFGHVVFPTEAFNGVIGVAGSVSASYNVDPLHKISSWIHQETLEDSSAIFHRLRVRKRTLDAFQYFVVNHIRLFN